MRAIGILPDTLNVNGKDYKIRTDYRDCLIIIQAFNDPDLTDMEKVYITLFGIFLDFEKMDADIHQEAYDKAIWFLDCGKQNEDEKPRKQMMDWEHDEDVIFPAINKVAKCEVREKTYMHWWTFIGYYMEIGECLYSSIINIRWKKANNKKLDKAEIEFYKNNKNMIELPRKMSIEEKEEYDRLNEMCN